MDHLDQLALGAGPAGVGPGLPAQGGEAARAERGQPPLRGPGGDPGVPCRPDQRDTVLDVGS